MLVKYDHNNSGGSRWITEQNWKDLEKAGWTIEWKKFLGEPAWNCEKEFNSIKEALEEFEKVTNQDVSDEGCNCCGAPHCFTWGNFDNNRKLIHDDNYKYASGERLLEYMYEHVPGKLRDACH